MRRAKHTWIGCERLTGPLGLLLAMAIASPAQTVQAAPEPVGFKVIISFDGTNGEGPGGFAQPVVRGTDGNLYGAASAGGIYGNIGAFTGGTIFRIMPGGGLTVIYNFCALPNCSDGSNPATLVLGTDGNFYGVAVFGGA